MAKFSNYHLILDELTTTLSHVKTDEFSVFANKILNANQIFVAGKGRSGFVSNSFAMRLNQLGKLAHVVGESTTPAIKRDDLFVIISGSGSTEHLRLLADKAKSVGANIVLITTKEDSAIGKLANTKVVLPAGTKYDEQGSAQPLGSLFEQASQLFLDSVVMGLMTEMDVSEQTMQQNHANLE
ncbi:TPA: 6-phospho-3-hexuloisomerase [Staphylococcus argenteus]|nr:6-phospho-3-hexuloisomerase [Staphylococcus argenteus]ATY56202.1 6-phospho-3-hexuloisomerase [Staphylococcus argenteus]ATZ86444.1 6-phospho-3-hexuloisomerase [Staphylococcus argenteus]EKF1505140.1 6-phospho-3-hexuloisomerase [Staphylococcus argenteus]KAA0799511.1 6-phospho-3-hexuloisomerase [Staphylococcus argenteus]MBE2084146.1 6-phospho-3-hexuloisomerase [Staphylococcus argenteus]